MRAVVHDRYGPAEVLHLEDIDPPVPNDDEVLIRIHATTVNRTDCALRAGEPFFSRFITGVRRPRQRVLGSEFAGTVELPRSPSSRSAIESSARSHGSSARTLSTSAWRRAPL
jgi:NADPH:quinone reductase-like Zn-dependent oxidoreductase